MKRHQLAIKQSMLVSFYVNGEAKTLEVKPYETLAEVLREKLGLEGVKLGCNRGECGECTVIADGEAILACSMLAVSADRKRIETIEGLGKSGQLHPIQSAFVEFDAVQCGYCTPGMILSLKALLDKNPKPSQSEVREAIAGNICRCGTYQRALKATMSVVNANKSHTDPMEVT